MDTLTKQQHCRLGKLVRSFDLSHLTEKEKFKAFSLMGRCIKLNIPCTIITINGKTLTRKPSPGSNKCPVT